MKKIFFLCWISGVLCHAQQFNFKTDISLPDTLQSATLATADIDNDGLLDYLVSATDSRGKSYFLTYKSDTIAGMSHKSTLKTTYSDAVYVLKDIDQDNDIDIIISGVSAGTPETVYLSNDGDFKFHPESITNVSARSIAFGDLTNDGKPELVLSGLKNNAPFFSIYRKINNEWRVIHDSVKVSATSVVICDFDKNSYNDLILTGRSADGVLVSDVLFNRGSLYFKRSSISSPIDGRISLADFNADGFIDAFISGKNSLGNSSNAVVVNSDGVMRVSIDSLPVLSGAEYLFADFNSNGKQDCHYFGVDPSARFVHSVLTESKATVSLNIDGAIHAQAGDYEHDGDLDVSCLVKGNTNWKLVVIENRSPVNKGPGKPPKLLTAKIFNRLFLYWERSVDDHTATKLLSYDVTLQGGNEDVMMGDFDLINLKRLTPSSGNQGTKNYVLIRSNLQSYTFTVQAIDNALHAGGAGICRPSLLCEGLETVAIEACRNEVIALDEPDALWFSFADGLLPGSSAGLLYKSSKTDTLFSLTPDGADACPKVKLYTILIRENLVRKTETTKHVCADKQYHFSVETGWPQIDWSSSNRGSLSHNAGIDFKTGVADTLKVKLMNGEGCVLQRNTVLKISRPDVKVEADAYQLIRGQEAHLKASGAMSYQWSPADGLNDVTIADPVAAPLHSTIYSVMGTDSIGCVGTANVRILVEGTAFVPNLFTPNEDGQNDELRIYGLEDATNFTFTIHNREGNIVYETQNINHATTIGWDGTARGVKQPNGVYYWKVKGHQQTGRPVQLNGKTSGSIVLIR